MAVCEARTQRQLPSLETESLTFMCQYLWKVGEKLELQNSTKSDQNDNINAGEEETLRQIKEAKAYLIANLHSLLQGVFIKELQGIFTKEFRREQVFPRSPNQTNYNDSYVSSFFLKNLMILPELRCLCISSFIRKGLRPPCHCDVFFDVADAAIVLKSLDSNPMNLLEELHLGFGQGFPVPVADLISIIKRLPHLSRLHLRCLNPDCVPQLMECLRDKASIKTLVINKSAYAMLSTVDNLASIKQLTTLELRGMNLPVSQVGQLVCSLANLNRLNFSDADFHYGKGRYVELLKWMRNNCPHGNCLVKKINLWLGDMSWRDLCEIPPNVLELIGITPFEFDLKTYQLYVKLENTIGVFPKINGKVANSTFGNFIKGNGEKITDISVSAYGHQQSSVLEKIHSLTNLRKVTLNDPGLDTPDSFSSMMSLRNTREFPYLVEFICRYCTVQPHGGLVGDILSHSPNLETSSLKFGSLHQPGESVTLNRQDLHNLFPVKFTHLKYLSITGHDLHIGEKEVDFIRSIAPALEELGDLGYWDIPQHRVIQLQKDAKEENLLLKLTDTTIT